MSSVGMFWMYEDLKFLSKHMWKFFTNASFSSPRVEKKKKILLHTDGTLKQLLLKVTL